MCQQPYISIKKYIDDIYDIIYSCERNQEKLQQMINNIKYIDVFEIKASANS